MSLERREQTTMTSEGARRRRAERWPAMLRRWLVECPRCAEVWLVVGARENDGHVCKDCGHSFVVKFSEAGRGRSSAAGRAAE